MDPRSSKTLVVQRPTVQWEKDSLFNKWCWRKLDSHRQKNHADDSFPPYFYKCKYSPKLKTNKFVSGTTQLILVLKFIWKKSCKISLFNTWGEKEKWGLALPDMTRASLNNLDCGLKGTLKQKIQLSLAQIS